MSKRFTIWILVCVAVVFAAIVIQRLHRANMVEVIGVYPISAEEPCYLVELRIRNVQQVFDFGGFTQELPGKPQMDWQTSWMEHILSEDGTKILADDSEISRKPELFRQDVRCAFFFHYLEVNRPLMTPFGEIRLPTPTDKPARLSMIQYEEPD